MKALIAEDDITSRKVLEILMKKWGYDVVSTRDGNEAWAALQAEDAPRLAILDWMMPGMDGIELCRRIRQEKRHHPMYIILLTALTNKEEIIVGLNAGADDYVAKPFDKDELSARIKVGQRIIDLQSALADRIKELQDALTHIKTLQGLLPICSYCHKIRDSMDVWEGLEQYIMKHSEADFTHSICPECMEKHFPE